MKKIRAHLVGQFISSNSAEAHSLHKKSKFGEKSGEKIQYSPSEAFHLIEKTKMDLFFRGKKIPKKQLMNKFQRLDKKIHLKHVVFNDLRTRGYVLKTALKFGADFRVYKGKEQHAKWLLFIEHESIKLALHEFAAKNRVAHSTRKKLLLAIVDDENKVTYYEIGWIRP